MLNKSIVCPVCKSPLRTGSSVCSDCKQDLSALIFLESQSEILYNQGLGLAQAGDDEQAIVMLRKSLDLDKTNLSAAIVLGKIYARRKDYIEARIIWNYAQQVYPESTELQEQLAALDIEIEAAHFRKAQVNIESERRERDSKRRKMLYWVAQIGFAFLLGCVGFGAYQLIFRSSKLGQPSEPITQVNITTLQAFQTAAVKTLGASQATPNSSSTPFASPSTTPTPTLSPTPLLPTSTMPQPSSTVNPTATPIVQNLLPLIGQAIGRDSSLAGLGLEFVQRGNIIYVTGGAPDIRTRYLIEVTVRSVPSVEWVDMSGVSVANGDITSAPSQCLISTGVQDGQLYLRDGPGTQYKIIGVLTEGEGLSIIKLGNWYQVITSGGVTGWVTSHYCRSE